MALRRDIDTKSFLLSRDRKIILEMLDQMGQKVENMIHMSIEALVERDNSKAQNVIDLDENVDEHEVEIEQECLRIIAVRQPVRDELRFYFSVLKIITDLERMGDEACNIAKYALKINEEPVIRKLVDIPHMASLSIEMLRDGLRSFRENAPEIAKKVFLQDNEIDALFSKIMDEIFLVISDQTQGQTTPPRNVILLQIVARHLERIGDHAANISERSFYMSTGKRIKKEIPLK
jgi:phosphate transport system protein